MDPQVGAVTKFLAYRLGQTPDTDLNTCPIAHQGGSAIEAMTIIAFALHLDPVFVGVHHLARFTFMSLVLPAAVGVIRAYEGKKPKE